MPRLYRAEFFTPDGTYVSAAPVSVETLENDYLALDKSTLSLPMTVTAEGDICHIVDMYGTTIYQGIVSDVQDDKYKREISVVPLMSLFDVQIYKNVSSINTDVEAWIKGAIESKYVSVADTLQRIPMTVTALTHTTGNISLESNVVELYAVIQAALEQLGIFVKISFDPQAHSYAVEISKVSASGAVIEADSAAILEKTVVLGGTISYNKAVVYRKDAESTFSTYYLHSDGSISTTNSDRLTPVREYIAIVDPGSDSWSTAALKAATEKLIVSDYQNYFEITVREDSKIVPTLEVGQAATILHGGVAFNSVLTNVILSGEIKTLVFGVVRLELTKKLTMNERK